MPYSKAVIGLVCGTLAAGTASAADWTGKGSLGGVLSRGNTDMETVNANLDVATEVGGWTYKLGASFLNTVEDDIASADRFELRGEANYALTERSYLFGALRYEDDRFTDFAYQAVLSGGYGYKFIATETTKFEGQIGLGYRKSEILVTGEEQDEPIVRGAMNFEHKLTGTTLIYDKFLVEHGEENTYIQNALGIEVKISDAFALALDYQVRQNSEVLTGTEKTDQVLTANLVYGF
jgi:putative salt-induced outer membrane protein